jgi:hypothetical protein
MSSSDAGPRLTKSDIDEFITRLFSELQMTLPAECTLERGPSLWARGYRLWVTLLDDGSPKQLRLRKLVMAIRHEPRKEEKGSLHLSREWYSTHPSEDRWRDMEAEDDRESTSEAVLEGVRDRFVRTVGVRRAPEAKPS